jgi:hypothetical protein
VLTCSPVAVEGVARVTANSNKLDGYMAPNVPEALSSSSSINKSNCVTNRSCIDLAGMYQTRNRSRNIGWL